MPVLILAADQAAARAGRSHLTMVASTLGTAPALVEVALVLVSELVTNAVLHGRSNPRLAVLARAGGGLFVGVGDDNSRYPVMQDEDQQALGGRGLRLLDSLATRWGVRPEPPGKVVWFELDADAA
jgi:anti-sigma regulatory factor (Ser/Thr protein kinase)